MDTMLIVITVASLAVAVTASVIAWRLAREFRAREDARVAALAADIAAAGDTPASTRAGGLSEPAPAGATPVDGVSDMFATSVRRQPSNRQLAPAAVLCGLAIAAVVGTLLLAGATGDASAPASRAPQPLELLSLRHAQQDGTTSITGLVRNPAGAPPTERVMAVVFFFDGSGAFVSSARAPLDFSRLAAGEESPFQVTVRTPPGVSRYRVSFRHAEGGIVPHVDRRESQR